MKKQQAIIENFHPASRDLEAKREAEAAEPAPMLFTVARFRPAPDRLLLKRLPTPKPRPGQIVRPEICEEQSEYGFVIAVGRDVDVPVHVVAKFSKFSGNEEIHFEDELKGDEYLMAYKHDIRGWFEDVDEVQAFAAR